MAQDVISNLYKALIDDGYDFKDEQTFRNSIQDSTVRRNLYNALIEDDYDFADFDTFSKSLGFGEEPAGKPAGTEASQSNMQSVDDGAQTPSMGYRSSMGVVSSEARNKANVGVPEGAQIKSEKTDSAVSTPALGSYVPSMQMAVDANTKKDVGSTNSPNENAFSNAETEEMPQNMFGGAGVPSEQLEENGEVEKVGTLNDSVAKATKPIYNTSVLESPWKMKNTEERNYVKSVSSKENDSSEYENATMNAKDEETIWSGQKYLSMTTEDRVTRGQKTAAFGNFTVPSVMSDEEKRIVDENQVAKEMVGREIRYSGDILPYYQEAYSKTAEGITAMRDYENAVGAIAQRYQQEMANSQEYQRANAIQDPIQRAETIRSIWETHYLPKVMEEATPSLQKFNEGFNNRFGNEIKQQYNEFGKAYAANTVEELEQDIKGYKNEHADERVQRNITHQLPSLSDHTIDAAEDLVQQSQHLIKAAERKGDTNFVKELGIGFKDQAFDIDNWMQGLTDMTNGAQMLRVLKKSANDEELTQDEEYLLQAIVANAAITNYYADQLSRGYKVGQSTAASLPLMIDMLTGVSAVSAGTNVLTKGLQKAIGQISNKAVRYATKGVYNLGKSYADALISGVTFSAPKTLGNAYDRQVDNYTFTETGQAQLGEEAESWATSLRKGLGDYAIEAESEIWGDQVLGKTAGVIARELGISAKIGAAPIVRSMKVKLDTPAMNTFRGVLKSAHFSGFAGELTEEWWGNLNNVARGDMTWDEFTDAENNIDIMLSVGVMQVGMGLTGGVTYLHEARKRNRIFEKNIKAIDPNFDSSRFDRLTIDDAKNFIMYTMNDDELTEQEKKDEIQYIYDKLMESAIVENETNGETEAKERLEAADAVMTSDDIVSEGEDVGAATFEEKTPESASAMNEEHENAAAEMEAMTGKTEEQLTAEDAIRYFINGTEEEKLVARRWLTSHAAMDSYMRKVQDDIDNAKQGIVDIWYPRQNGRGEIEQTVLVDGRTGWIRNNSSDGQKIYFVDNDGKVEEVPNEMIRERGVLGAYIDIVNGQLDEIEQQMIAEYQQKLSGIEIKPGMSYDVITYTDTDEKGELVGASDRVTIDGVGENGEVVITYADGSNEIVDSNVLVDMITERRVHDKEVEAQRKFDNGNNKPAGEPAGTVADVKPAGEPAGTVAADGPAGKAGDGENVTTTVNNDQPAGMEKTETPQMGVNEGNTETPAKAGFGNNELGANTLDGNEIPEQNAVQDEQMRQDEAKRIEAEAKRIEAEANRIEEEGLLPEDIEREKMVDESKKWDNDKGLDSIEEQEQMRAFLSKRRIDAAYRSISREIDRVNALLYEMPQDHPDRVIYADRLNKLMEIAPDYWIHDFTTRMSIDGHPHTNKSHRLFGEAAFDQMIAETFPEIAEILDDREATTAREYIIDAILGSKLNPEDVARELTGKTRNGKPVTDFAWLKTRFDKVNGKTIEKLADIIADDIDSTVHAQEFGGKGNVDSLEIRDEILDILSSYDNINALKRDAYKGNIASAQQLVDARKAQLENSNWEQFSQKLNMSVEDAASLQKEENSVRNEIFDLEHRNFDWNLYDSEIYPTFVDDFIQNTQYGESIIPQSAGEKNLSGVGEDASEQQRELRESSSRGNSLGNEEQSAQSDRQSGNTEQASEVNGSNGANNDAVSDVSIHAEAGQDSETRPVRSNSRGQNEALRRASERASRPDWNDGDLYSNGSKELVVLRRSEDGKTLVRKNSNGKTEYKELPNANFARELEYGKYEHLGSVADLSTELARYEEEQRSLAQEKADAADSQSNNDSAGEKDAVMHQNAGVEYVTATEEDINNNKPLFMNGQRVYVMMVFQSGTQIGAGQFSKPHIDSIYLTNGKEVKVSDLQVQKKTESSSDSNGVKTNESEGKHDTHKPTREEVRRQKDDAIAQKVNADIDRQVAEKKKRVDELGKEKGKKQREYDTRNGLFGDTKEEPNDLFGETFDNSKENFENAIKPLNEEISKLQDEIQKLEDGREKDIADAIKADKSQGSIFDVVEEANRISEEELRKSLGLPKKDERVDALEQSFVDKVSTNLLERRPMGIVDLRKIAKEIGLEARDGKLQELAERAIINTARTIATDEKKNFDEKYDSIVDLYTNQPTISMRDSTRVELQQYSTPIPIAYLACEFVRGINPKSILEPSGGNGMMVFGFDPRIIHINEIDSDRLENLVKEDYDLITNQDGREPFKGKYDAIITNPPFGSSAAKVYGDYRISGLDPQMILNALESMKTNGRAAIIMGGHTAYASNGALQGNDKMLYGYLYNNYNVVDVINISGGLYAKQGTRYPVRLILIDGKRNPKDGKIYAPVQSKARANEVQTFDELKDRVNEVLLQSVSSRTDDNQRKPSDNGGDNQRGNTGESHTDISSDRSESVLRTNSNDGVRHLEPTHDERGTTEGKSQHRSTEGKDNEQLDDVSVSSDAEGRTDDGRSRNSSEERTRKSDGSNRTNADAGRLADVNGIHRPSMEGGLRSDAVSRRVRSVKKENVGTGKSAYPTRSNSNEIGSVIPEAVLASTEEALSQFDDIDQFVTDKLGYANKEELQNALAAEQIDSVALAIKQLEANSAFIIGDMTGVGKGRQAASIIRYAHQLGKVPIFVTEKPELFSDIYRDLRDIGCERYNPFIISDNAIADMTDEEGVTVYKHKSNEELQDAINKGELPKGYDYVVMTYSQVQLPEETAQSNRGRRTKQKAKNDFIRRLSNNNILVLDESHNASGSNGEGNVAKIMMDLVRRSKGTVFLSATYAKTPANMPIYAIKTSMSKANVSQEQLIEAITKGGVPLQEIMSQALTQSHQMIRRERSFDGVKIDWHQMEGNEQKISATFDEAIGIMNDIIRFQRDYINDYIDAVNEQLAAEQGNASETKSANLGYKSQPAMSKLFNLSRQLIFAQKAEYVADFALDCLANNEKPVIAVSNTMESFLRDLPLNEEIAAPTYAIALERALQSVMRMRRRNDVGDEFVARIHPQDLDPAGEKAYYELVAKMKNMSSDLSISPIDVIIKRITDAGYTVGEMTGRDVYVMLKDNGKAVIKSREEKDNKATQRKFNKGNIDVIIMNRSASTGISLHASSRFADQRQRHMISAQAELDVNKEVQMRGRIDRTGQIHRGKYTYIISPVPAEQRLLMMLQAKLKSLDANTTADQKSEFNKMEIVDFLNKYGDEIIAKYLEENPEFNNAIYDPLGLNKEKGSRQVVDSPAEKVSGRVALLPVAEQEKFYNDIAERYTAYIDYLDAMGSNDLEIKSIPFNARTMKKQIFSEGREPGGTNIFADNAYLETVEVDVLRKPMTSNEIKDAIDSFLAGRTPKEYRDYVYSVFDAVRNEKIAARKSKSEERLAAKIGSIRAKYEKAISKGKDKAEAQEEMEKEIVDEKAKYKSAQEAFEQNTNVSISSMQGTFNALSIGSPTWIPIDTSGNGYTRGIVLGYKFGAKMNEDGKVEGNITPSSTSIVFATLDGRRRLEIPMSQMPTLDGIVNNNLFGNRTLLNEARLENWDNLRPTKTKETEHIITGNIIQALADQSASRGRLISYTTSNGRVKQGILLPQDVEITSIKQLAELDAEDILKRINNFEKVKCTNGVVIRQDNTYPRDYFVYAPKSKQQGGNIFLDDELRSLSKYGFEQSGNSMKAEYTVDNLRKAIDRLNELGVREEKETEMEEVNPDDEPDGTPGGGTPTSKAEKKSTSDNIGYHAGDLGKSEFMSDMGGGSRGTGHFGTGTYFVGSKDSFGRSYEDRPIKTVDFNGYKLFKPKNAEEGIKVHDFLKDVNRFFSINPDTLISKEQFEEWKNEWDSIDDAMYDDYDRNMTDYAMLAKLGEKIIGSKAYDNYPQSNTEIEAAMRNLRLAVSRARYDGVKDAFDRFYNEETDAIATLLGTTGDELRSIIDSIRLETNALNYEQKTKSDSASTMLMKKLGYEGVDVRGIDGLDNTKYGSVIYDLKPESEMQIGGNDDTMRNDTPAKQLVTETVADLLNGNSSLNIQIDRKNGYKKNESKAEVLKTTTDIVYGWAEGNTIHITPSGFNPNTPIHEYTHLWAKAMQKHNNEEWKHIVELLKGTDEWEKVKNDKNYSGLKDDDAIASETLSRISGKKNAERMIKESEQVISDEPNAEKKELKRKLLQRVKDALQRFWNWVGKNLFEIHFNNVDEVADRVIWDLTNKTDFEFEVNESMKSQQVLDKALVEKLENGPKRRAYRSMQMIDGRLYPPMSAKVNGQLRNPSKIGVWEQSVENPELADDKGNFKLDKGNKKSVPARYNPYFHTTTSPFNDQFSEAYNRDNLVIVEVEYPESELTSGYKAYKAKDSVGEMDWHKGPVSGELVKNGFDRKVVLTRWIKPIRVVPNTEVADEMAKILKETNITIPINVVTPKLANELARRGVVISIVRGNVSDDNKNILEQRVRDLNGGKIPEAQNDIEFSIDEERPLTPEEEDAVRQYEENARMYGETTEDSEESRVFMDDEYVSTDITPADAPVFEIDDNRNGKPVRKKGEGPAAYSKRLKDWKEYIEKRVELGSMPVRQMGEDPNEFDAKMRAWKEKNAAFFKNEAGEVQDDLLEAMRGNLTLNEDAQREYDELSSLVDRDILSREELTELDTKVAKKSIRDAAIDYVNRKQESNYEDALFADDIRKHLTKEERKAMLFILEGDWDLEANPVRDVVLEYATKIAQWYKDVFEAMGNADALFGAGQKENYVTHMWDRKKSDPRAWKALVENGKKYKVVRSRFTKTRTIPSYVEGIRQGLVPKYDDIADIIVEYGRLATQSIENLKFINFVSQFKVDGNPILRKRGGNGSLYTHINSHALDDYDVLKDMEKWVGAVLEDRMESSGLWKGYDTWSNVSKKMKLSLSFFHHLALTESALSTMGPGALKVLGKNIIWDTFAQAYRDTKAGKGNGSAPKRFYQNITSPALRNPELTRRAVSHLVQLGVASDYDAKQANGLFTALHNMTKNMADEAEGVGKKVAAKSLNALAAMLDETSKGMDKLLWTYLHDSYKLYAFDKISKEVYDAYNKGQINASTRDARLDEVGQFVNDNFGGQNWEVLGIKPSTLQWFRRVLLSIDWTTSSVLRQPFAFTGMGNVRDEKYGGKDIRKKYGAKVWLRFGALLMLSNLLNAAFRAKDEDDEKRKSAETGNPSPYDVKYPNGMNWYDYTMYGNTKGKRTNIFIGRFDDGREKYLRQLKQAREVFEFFMNDGRISFPNAALKKIHGKMNPILQTVMEAAFGSDFTGWDNQEIRGTNWQRIKETGRLALETIEPMSVNKDREFELIDLVAPISRGYSKYKAIEDFKRVLMRHAGDDEALRIVTNNCVMNGIDPEKCLDSAKSRLKSEDKARMKKGIKNIDDAYDKFDIAEGKEKEELEDIIDEMEASAGPYIPDATKTEKLIAEAADVDRNDMKIYDSMKNRFDKRDDIEMLSWRGKAQAKHAEFIEAKEAGLLDMYLGKTGEETPEQKENRKWELIYKEYNRAYRFIVERKGRLENEDERDEQMEAIRKRRRAFLDYCEKMVE